MTCASYVTHRMFGVPSLPLHAHLSSMGARDDTIGGVSIAGCFLIDAGSTEALATLRVASLVPNDRLEFLQMRGQKMQIASSNFRGGSRLNISLSVLLFNRVRPTSVRSEYRKRGIVDMQLQFYLLMTNIRNISTMHCPECTVTKKEIQKRCDAQ
ncbi:hypothetical protein CEXT_239041 [Caerostris extrusa]|uniref:Uncharacterized protein n=1 Tax=Caerostris extrusa TaxID=172846 RepID=A0AAV4RBF7_CAEEX|nr:hypothetical protein CEXT_239041 [Caerostris extrusa]